MLNQSIGVIENNDNWITTFNEDIVCSHGLYNTFPNMFSTLELQVTYLPMKVSADSFPKTFGKPLGSISRPHESSLQTQISVKIVWFVFQFVFNFFSNLISNNLE